MTDEPGSSRWDVEVVVEAAAWTQALPAAEAVARRAATASLAGVPQASGARGLCLVLADDALLRRLNREFRGKDRPTNVLAFAGEAVVPPGERPSLGDVVLAQETCAEEARAQGKSLADHLSHLVVHGVLHLCGYDHESGEEAARMEALEVGILGRLGIADPYAARVA